MKDNGTRRAFAVGILLAALLSAYLWGPLPWSREPAHIFSANSAESVALREAIALIPDDAVVSARPRLVTQLTHRERVYEFPTPFLANNWGDGSLEGTRLPEADDVEYVLELPPRLSGVPAEVFPRLKDQGFSEVFSKDGVVLLKRVAEPAGDPGQE